MITADTVAQKNPMVAHARNAVESKMISLFKTYKSVV